ARNGPARAERPQRRPRAHLARRGGGAAGLAAFGQLDAVAVRIADETEARTALAARVRRPLGLDSLARALCEGSVEVLDPDRDVPVAAAEVVAATVVVECQLEHRLLVADREEVVRRLQLAVADDVEVAREGEAERLV